MKTPAMAGFVTCIALGLAACANSQPTYSPAVVRTIAVVEPAVPSSVVILHRHPAAAHHCRKHRNHWHCSR